MANGATINVLYFAQIAEITQKRQEPWPLETPIAAQQWLAQLESKYPDIAPVDRLKLAINQYHANSTDMINPGDEVAVFEPVTGG